jgi:hypothetical protein
MKYVYGIIALLLVSMGATIWMQHNNNAAMSTTLKAVTQERDDAVKNEKTLTDSGSKWQVLAQSCNKEFEAYKNDQHKLAEQNDTAVANATAKAQAASLAAARANARVEAAMRKNQPCAAILNAPVCLEALQ